MRVLVWDWHCRSDSRACAYGVVSVAGCPTTVGSFVPAVLYQLQFNLYILKEVYAMYMHTVGSVYRNVYVLYIALLKRLVSAVC